MRISRPGDIMRAAAVAATLAATPLSAQQVDPYPGTLDWGTGLIDIPVAWVSPNSGDVWVTASGKTIPSVPNPSSQNFATRWNTNLSVDTHWWGRVSVGASAYSQNPEWGFFGQALLLKNDQFGPLPAIAVGARNIGPYNHEERFLIGHDIALDSSGKYVEVTSTPLFKKFHTAPTLYAVATKEFALSSVNGRLPSAFLSLSVGWGDGIFSQDAGLGAAYNRHGQIAKGLFLGGRFTAHPSLNTTLMLLAENNGWDWNAGLVGDWRGLQAGLYGTELEEGTTRRPDSFLIYNYAKLNFRLGYSGNIMDISRGVILRSRITELTREQQRLRLEIAEREHRIAGLEVALRKAQAGELAEIAQRRQAMEQQIQQERDAINRAMQRLQQLQQGKTPPPSNPPANPPATPPSTSTPSLY